MSETKLPWTATDKPVLGIFILECVLLFISVVCLLLTGDLMFYPCLMQAVKAITLGICLFAFRQT